VTLNNGEPARGAPELLTGSGTVTSDRFTVTANEFFTVKLSLGSSSYTNYSDADGGVATASSNYFDTLTFATDRPVFDLPSGYTANSVSGHIMDNRFVAAAAAPDFNGDGVVDAADYVAWRKGLGTTYAQADYAIWRGNFGATAAGAGATGSASAVLATVPEPSSIVLLVAAAVVGLVFRVRIF
jgi:hypothetical protein